MKNILLLLFMVFISGCSNKYSKENYISTYNIGNGLYKETFQVYSGGVFAGNSYSYYLTDSINFRIYIGTKYHDDERFLCELSNPKTVKASKVLFHTDDTIEVNYYSIEQLKKEGKFE